MGRIPGNLFVALTGAYGLTITLFLALRLLVGEQWTLIAIVNSFVHLMLIPALALLPLCMIRRRWRLALTQLPAALVFTASYGGAFLPQPIATAPDAFSFSVMTYNLHIEKWELDPIISLIREADADIVALQEFSRRAGRRLAPEFAEQYPYQAFHIDGASSSWGQGILSRYPILSDEYWHINLGHQRVEILIQDEPITVYNTHPAHLFRLIDGGRVDLTSRRLELASVVDRAAGDEGAVIILGDFNMSDQSEDYQRISAQYVDNYREVGWGMGFTFPDFSHPNSVPGAVSIERLPIPPLIRLDYIFHNDSILPLEARMWPTSGGSDHRPVFARLALML